MIQKEHKIFNFKDGEIPYIAGGIKYYVYLNDIDKNDAFSLGILYQNFQYYLSVCREFNSDGTIKVEEDENLFYNTNKLLEKYNDLLDYIVTQYTDQLEDLQREDPNQYYQYLIDYNYV